MIKERKDVEAGEGGGEIRLKALVGTGDYMKAQRVISSSNNP